MLGQRHLTITEKFTELMFGQRHLTITEKFTEQMFGQRHLKTSEQFNEQMLGQRHLFLTIHYELERGTAVNCGTMGNFIMAATLAT